PASSFSYSFFVAFAKIAGWSFWLRCACARFVSFCTGKCNFLLCPISLLPRFSRGAPWKPRKKSTAPLCTTFRPVVSWCSMVHNEPQGIFHGALWCAMGVHKKSQ
ncbi:unnamed protein product, partial [Ectocarpus sp. 12 AP-2014]